VPRNPRDAEAENQRQTLEHLLQEAFDKRTTNNSPDMLTQIESATTMKELLAVELQNIKNKLIKRMKILRTATGAETIALSNIAGPGGN
jgi:hypothetical protein